MKQMVYTNRHPREVLHSGEYRGYKFAITSFGSHPCAYIENKMGACDEDDEKVYGLGAHGDITYCGECLWDEEDKTSWIGWAYNLYTDYARMGVFTREGKKWTTEEIYEEVKEVIDNAERQREEREAEEKALKEAAVAPIKEILNRIFQIIGKSQDNPEYRNRLTSDMLDAIDEFAVKYGIELVDYSED